MRTRIECPYCDAMMEYRELGFRSKMCFYECPRCLSRSPQTYGQVNARNIAKKARKRAFQPVRMSDLGFIVKADKAANRAV